MVTNKRGVDTHHDADHLLRQAVEFLLRGVRPELGDLLTEPQISVLPVLEH